MKRIIDTCLFQPVSSDTVLPLRKMGAAFCFVSTTASETGVFRGGFASSSNLLFASVSHGGVLRVCFLFSFDTIHLVFGGVLFSHHHGSGDLSFITIKSPNGSRVNEFTKKKKEYRHIERLFGGRVGGVCFTTMVFSIFLAATWANISV